MPNRTTHGHRVVLALAAALALSPETSLAGAAVGTEETGVFEYNQNQARGMMELERGHHVRGIPDATSNVDLKLVKAKGWQYCALTFDDGPHPVHTRQVLDILNRHGVRATYFPVARPAMGQGDLIRDYLKSGHEIGNHSLTHRDLRRASPATLHAEIAESTAILRGLGADPVLFRPPYGGFNEAALTEARAAGMRTVLWTVDSRDWQARNADTIVRRVNAALQPASVVLLHATYPSTVSALPRIIEGMRARGCRFVTLSKWVDFMMGTSPADRTDEARVAATSKPAGARAVAPVGPTKAVASSSPATVPTAVQAIPVSLPVPAPISAPESLLRTPRHPAPVPTPPPAAELVPAGGPAVPITEPAQPQADARHAWVNGDVISLSLSSGGDAKTLAGAVRSLLDKMWGATAAPSAEAPN